MKVSEKKLVAYDALFAGRGELGGDVLVPCAGTHCHKKIRMLTEMFLSAYTGKDYSQLLCSFCAENDGVGELLSKWNEACPKIFREGETKTKFERLPAIWKTIKQWNPESDKGLYIFGETGKCKSRMLFSLLYHRCVKTGTPFEVVRGGDFRRQIMRAYSEKNISAAVEYVDKLIAVPVLAFDDFAQDVLSENMLAELWRLIDSRTSNGTPTIILSNYSTGEILSKYGNVPSVRSMCRRIDEFTERYEIT